MGSCLTCINWLVISALLFTRSALSSVVGRSFCSRPLRWVYVTCREAPHHEGLLSDDLVFLFGQQHMPSNHVHCSQDPSHPYSLLSQLKKIITWIYQDPCLLWEESILCLRLREMNTGFQYIPSIWSKSYYTWWMITIHRL